MSGLGWRNKSQEGIYPRGLKPLGADRAQSIGQTTRQPGGAVGSMFAGSSKARTGALADCRASFKVPPAALAWLSLDHTFAWRCPRHGSFQRPFPRRLGGPGAVLRVTDFPFVPLIASSAPPGSPIRDHRPLVLSCSAANRYCDALTPRAAWA
jgi:hypothetical protein